MERVNWQKAYDSTDLSNRGLSQWRLRVDQYTPSLQVGEGEAVGLLYKVESSENWEDEEYAE